MPETIRPLSAGDFDAVVEIDRSFTGNSRRSFFEKRLAAALKDPGDYIYVGLDDGGKLAGYAMARLVAGEFGQPGARASLDAIGVEAGHQGKGVGHKLLKAVEDVLRHKSVGEMTTQVLWSYPDMLGFFADTGFELAPRLVLTRDTSPVLLNEEPDEDDDESMEADFSAPEGDDPGALSTDKVPVRSFEEGDLDAVIRIDKKNTGKDRSAYFKRKTNEVLHQSGIRVSLTGLVDDLIAGFIMARVDFGEFGRTSSEAVMDALGVDPGFQGQGVGQALMAKLMANLAILQVEHIRTEVDWNDTALVSYLDALGFVPAQILVLSRKLSR